MNLNVKKMSLQQGVFKELAFTSQSPESSLMITDFFSILLDLIKANLYITFRILQRDKVRGVPWKCIAKS